MLPSASRLRDSAGKGFRETTMVMISSGAAGMSARKAASEASKKGAGPRSLLIFGGNEDTISPRQSSRLPTVHPAGSAQDSPVQPSRAMLGSRRPGGTLPMV